MIENRMYGVVGFFFDFTSDRVVLIRKNRPDWQAGKLNGVGGHIEPGEGPHRAMTREFEEEAGRLLFWDHYVTLTGEWGCVFFFRAWGDIENVQSGTDELLEVHQVHSLPDDCLPNLHWLIPLAAYQHDSYQPIQVHEKIGR